MPVYVYRGTNRSGSAVNGEQAANNKTELLNLLKRQQIKVSKLSEKGKEFNFPTFGRVLRPRNWLCSRANSP